MVGDDACSRDRTKMRHGRTSRTTFFFHSFGRVIDTGTHLVVHNDLA